MTNTFTITNRAHAAFECASVWWAANQSLQQAAKWLNGLSAAIDELARNPDR
jgi:plasmid stabilization system protein ParE